MYRLLSLLILTMFFTSSTHAISANSEVFIDVLLSDEHYEAIQYVKENKIVNGYEDGSYKPEQPINRAEFTKIIVEAIVGQTPLEHAGKCFSDVDSGEWFYPYVCYAERVGMIGGYPDGSFKPAQNIQFVESAKIISNAFKYPTATDSIWYRPFVQNLASKKAIPTSVSSFDASLTRGQMAEVIFRLKTGNTGKESKTYEELEKGRIVDNEAMKTKEDIDTTTQTPYKYEDGNYPLGVNAAVSSAQKGKIYACNTTMNGGGAHAVGSWVNEDEGTWTREGKATVDGNNSWPNAEATFSLSGDKRIITSTGVPTNTGTGNFPISSSDDAYQYDRNPNSVSEQSVSLSLDANPTPGTPSCVDLGMIGIALNGVAIFNGFDGAGRDAVAYEIQDACDGHPERSGEYHYHNLSQCFEDKSEGHSDLFGYILDGFGLYGVRGENGEILTNADLDECHGHSHEISWDGSIKTMYHYHATNEFPYTIGCYRGTPNKSNTSQAGPLTGPSDQTGPAPGGQQGPPQEARDSCSGKSTGASCSFPGGRGETVSGTCQSKPDGFVCVP